MIDLHCHVLPGIDDGPRDMEGSLALARRALASGARTLVATSHVSYRFPNTAAVIGEGVQRVNEALRAEGIELEVVPGAEIALETLRRLDDAELGALTLGGGRSVLLEPPLAAVGGELEEAVTQLQRRGFRVVLAHPERCPSFHRDPDRLERMVASGVVTSVTASSFTGRFGAPVQRLTELLAYRGLVHDVASDAHDAVRRPPDLGSVLRVAAARMPGLDGQVTWMTEQVPRALLTGEAIPPAPPSPRPRRFSLRTPWR